MMKTLIEITLSMSAVILIMLIITPFMKKRYSAKWRYYIWLVIAIRLCIPFNISVPHAPFTLKAPQEKAYITESENSSSLTSEFNNTAEKYNNQKSQTQSEKFPTNNLIFLLWTAGAVSFFAYHIYGYSVFKRKVKPFLSDCDHSELNAAARELKIKNTPKIKMCGKISSPMMMGFFKPVILIPDKEYNALEMNGILRHELIHFKRGDLWYKLILVIAQSIHFFNPLVHIMVKNADRDIEYSCDEAVVNDKDMTFRKDYSNAILKSMYHNKSTAFSTSFSENSSSKKQRFGNILDTKAKKNGIIIFIILLIIAVSAAAFFSLKTEDKPEYDLNAVTEKLKNLNIYDENIVIIENGEIKKRSNFDEFMKNTEMNKPDEMTVCNILSSGEPVFIHIYYDGDYFYTVEDDSRVSEKIENEQIYSFSGKYLISENDGEHIQYFITEDGSLTYSEIIDYLQKSAVYTHFPKFRLLFSLNSELLGKEKYKALQKSVDNGQYPWRLSEFDTARQYAKDEFNWEDITLEKYNDKKDSEIIMTVCNPSGELWEFQLIQPVRKGEGGIWIVNSCKPLSFEATLYFTDSECQYLIPEKRLIILKKDSLIEYETVNEIIKGPDTKGLFSTITGDVRALSLTIDDGSCTVTLSKEFLKECTGGSARETMAIYSIVNSLCELKSTERVKLSIEGDEPYNGNYDISGYFKPDKNLIRKD